MNKRIKILTPIPARVSETWRTETTTCRVSGQALLKFLDLLCKLRLPFFPNLKQKIIPFLMSISLIKQRKEFDVIITGGDLTGHMFSLFQRVFPFKRTPHIMIECFWEREKSRIRRFLKKLQLRFSVAGVDRCIVVARHEIGSFAQEFSIPAEKFTFVPYHTTVEGYNFAVNSENFIFAGGNSGRDYETLIRAAAQIPMNCIIAATESRLFQGLDIPANIRIKGVTHEQFRELMAKAYLVVVPTEKGLLRSVGQQTFLNAMAMGKVCVVTDPQGACDYIEHGKDGFLTEPGDFESLRLILDILIKDPKLAAAIGKNAAEKARLYSTEDSMKGIINVAREIVQSNTRKNTVK